MRCNAPIYIVEDDAAVSHSLDACLQALGCSVTMKFETGEAILDSLASLDDGCILLDLNLPGLSGWEIQHALQQRGCKFPVIFLTGRGDIGQAVRAMRMGAVDFLEKPFDVTMLENAIETAQERLFEQSSKGAATERSRDRLKQLSSREREVLAGLIDGQSNKQIAYAMGLSPRTVEIYRAKLMDKLGAKSLSDALRIAFAANAELLPA